MLRGYFKIKYFQRAILYSHAHYPKILLNHINIDEYEQREAKEVANTVLFAKKKKKKKYNKTLPHDFYNTICDVKNEPCGSEQHKQNIER